MSQTGSFDFYPNYSDSALKLQPELYGEINRILNNEFFSFNLIHKRKAIVLDVGAAGLLPYNLDSIEKVVIFDIFEKPDDMALHSNCEWITGDILSGNSISSLLETYGNFDYIVMSSLLHHLCDDENNIIQNINICFENVHKLISNDGKIYIFESTCASFFAKIQDVLYPISNSIFKKIFKFTNVRMLSYNEIILSLDANGLNGTSINFKQPKKIAQMYWSIPVKIYPLKVDAICATHSPRGSEE